MESRAAAVLSPLPGYGRGRAWRREGEAAPLGLSLRLEDVACALVFAFFAVQGAVPGIAPAQAHEITGSAPTTYTTVGGVLMQLIVNSIIVLLLLRYPRLLLRSLRAVPVAGMLGLLAVASTAWSLDPLLTLRRGLPFALAGCFGVWFGTRFSSERQLEILRLAMVGLALGTIALVFLWPAYGIEQTPGHPHDWKGVFTQKNACGRMMVLATATVLFGGRMTLRRTMSLALFALVLVMSGSRGAWLIEGAILLLGGIFWIVRRTGLRLRTALGVAIPAGCVAVGGAAVLWLPRLMHLLGRDTTLSGRTLIWPWVLHFIAERPLLGYGYDAFWRGMQGPSLQIDAALHFIVEHAHNGFLEIGLELGGVGLGLFLLSWLDAWRKLWPLWRRGDPRRIAFPVAVLVLVALYDLDENTLLIFNGAFWVLYMAALAAIGATARDQHHKSSIAPHAMLREQ